MNVLGHDSVITVYKYVDTHTHTHVCKYTMHEIWYYDNRPHCTEMWMKLLQLHCVALRCEVFINNNQKKMIAVPTADCRRACIKIWIFFLLYFHGWPAIYRLADWLKYKTTHFINDIQFHVLRSEQLTATIKVSIAWDSCANQASFTLDFLCWLFSIFLEYWLNFGLIVLDLFEMEFSSFYRILLKINLALINYGILKTCAKTRNSYNRILKV